MIAAKMPCYPGEKGSYTFFQNFDDPLDAPIRGMNFICPGCGKVVGVRFTGDRSESGLWRWDNNRDAPTLRPSIIHRDCGWHGYLTAGKWIDFDESVQCDACGEIVPRDEIAKVIAYGIETSACDRCRERAPP